VAATLKPTNAVGLSHPTAQARIMMGCWRTDADATILRDAAKPDAVATSLRDAVCFIECDDFGRNAARVLRHKLDLNRRAPGTVGAPAR
jgi:hypothetical protein